MPLKHNQSSDYKYTADYCTPKSAWEQISEYIPKDKTIWEPFYCDGVSCQFLQELGYDVIHKDEDFFKTNYEDTVIVSNPPFNNLKKILTRLKHLDHPFILIMPAGTICTQYFKTLFPDIQIIIPAKRIQFLKNGDQLTRCYFDTMFYAYKMNLQKDLIMLK